MKSAPSSTSVLFVLLAAAATSTACNNQDRPPGSGDPSGYTSASGGTSGSAGSSGTTSSTSSSSGVLPRGPETCEGALQLAEETPELRKAGGAPPPLGGTIEPGIYVLSEVDFYEGGMSSGTAEEPPSTQHTGVKAKKTLYVAGNLMRVVGARSAPNAELPSDATEAWTFGPNGLKLDTKTVCPQAGVTKSIPYSAVGPALSLFVDDAHREVYMKR